MITLREAALLAVAEKIGDMCSVWEGIGARDVEEVLREAARHGLVALAEPVQPQTMTLQEVWDAAGGNSGIKPTKQDVLDALRLLDEVCDAADARLVAAAPCLLEALRLAEKRLIAKCDQNLVSFNGEDVDTLTAIRAAIAKAEDVK